MGHETRVIFRRLQDAASDRRYWRVYRDRGFWVLHNRITGTRRYYKHPDDIRRLLCWAEPIG